MKSDGWVTSLKLCHNCCGPTERIASNQIVYHVDMRPFSREKFRVRNMNTNLKHVGHQGQVSLLYLSPTAVPRSYQASSATLSHAITNSESSSIAALFFLLLTFVFSHLNECLSLHSL